MEVTRKNFKEALPLVKKSIDAADFLAIDSEFTGLMSGRDVNAFDPPAEYYRRLRDGAGDFLLIQFGLVAFRWDAASSHYMNDAYNFYVFPRVRPGPDRVFLCQSSSLEFLASQRFDFNKLLAEGIPYLTEPTESVLREKLQERQKTYSNGQQQKQDIAIPQENKQQIDSILARVKEFLEASEPEYLEVDRCNAFIRRLVFQEVALRFKEKAFVESKTQENSNRILKISRLSSSDQIRNREEEKKKGEWEELEEAVGFSRVARLVTESEKLVIGHNMVLDMLHTLNHFYQPLPEDYESFKEFAHCMFPKSALRSIIPMEFKNRPLFYTPRWLRRILDTKYMSSLPPFKDKVSSSVLPHLLATLSEEPFSVPHVGSLEGRGYLRATDKSHEAGYDAYITGLCFLAMHGHLARMRGDTDGPQRVAADAALLKPFLDKMYLSKTAHQDSPYMNLAGADPTPSRDHVFHVSFPKVWSRSDISQLFSPFGPVFVNFVDDASALVSLTRREQARSAARGLAQRTPRDVTVTPYRLHRAQVAGNQTHWLSKERLEVFRQQAQVIAASKAAKADSSRIVTDNGVSSTTSGSFIPLKVERPCGEGAAAGAAGAAEGAKGAEGAAGRKRTSSEASSSGTFDVADEPRAPREPHEPHAARALGPALLERAATPERTGAEVSENKTEAKEVEVIDAKAKRAERRASKHAASAPPAPAAKRPRAAGTPERLSTGRTPRASAFEESDNWD